MKGKPQIFISYRRQDASASAGRLFDWLIPQFGRTHIFLDTDQIPLGEPFPDVLDKRLSASNVLLAVIGPAWAASSDVHGGRRLDDPHDFVRREIASALERGVRIIPVLVGGAQMPRAEELPVSISALANLNAVSIDDVKFDSDFDRLVDDIYERPRNFLRRKLDMVQRVVYVAKWALLLVPALAVVMALAVWIHVLDFLTLDSRIAGYLMRFADATSERPQDPGILIAAIDERSEQELGREFVEGDVDIARLTEWRRDHARLVRRAASAGAKAVVFDLMFPRESDADAEIVQAAIEARTRAVPMRVVFAVKDLVGEQPDLSAALRGNGTWGSACLFRRLGMFNVPLAVVIDPGGETEYFTGTTPALSLVAMRSAEDSMSVDVERRRIVSARPIRFSAVELVPRGSCSVYRSDDVAAMMLVWPSPNGYWRDRTRMLSYADLLQVGAVPDERLTDRIVLVGPVKNKVDEIVFRRGFSPEQVHGVELHADAIARLTSGRIVTTPTVDVQGWITVAMVLTGAATSVLTSGLSRVHRRSILAGATALYALVTIGFAIMGHLLNAHYDLSAFLASHFLLRRLQKRRLPAEAHQALS